MEFELACAEGCGYVGKARQRIICPHCGAATLMREQRVGVEGAELVPDYTYLSALDCPRYFYYTQRLRLRPARLSLPMHAGKAMHAALRVVHNYEGVDAAVQALTQAWEGVVVLPTHRYGYLTLGHLEVVLRNYAEMAARRRWNVTVGPEHAVVAPLRQVGQMPYGGIIDLFVDDAAGGRYIVDHKCTTSSITEWWAKQWNFSQQLRGYQLLAEEQDESVRGAAINAIHIGPYAADPPEKWRKRESAPFALYGPFHFSGVQLYETARWIGERLKEIEWRTAQEAKEAYPESAWPQRGTHRECSTCNFYAVCAANGKQTRTQILKLEYRKVVPAGKLQSGADAD